MKKLILAILMAGALTLRPVPAQAHGGGGLGFGLASGFILGAAATSAFASPWYYDGYYRPYSYYGGWPYYRYGYYDYSPSYYYYAPAPRYQSAPAVQPSAPAPAAQPAPTTIINNYYYNSSPMSSANTLFGR